MTTKEAARIVFEAYPAAYESTRFAWHTIYSGPINKSLIGDGDTTGQAWKAAAAHVLQRWPKTARTLTSGRVEG